MVSAAHANLTEFASDDRDEAALRPHHGKTLIRLRRDMAGQTHGMYWDLRSGDVITLDRDHAARYVAAGIAEPVNSVDDIERHWRADADATDGPWVSCRACHSPINPDNDAWVIREAPARSGDEVVGHVWHRPEHARCA